MQRGYSRPDAEKFARRNETGRKIAGGINAIMGGAAKYGVMAAKGLDNHFREQYGQSSQATRIRKEKRNKKAERRDFGGGLGSGAGPFESSLW